MALVELTGAMFVYYLVAIGVPLNTPGLTTVVNSGDELRAPVAVPRGQPARRPHDWRQPLCRRATHRGSHSMPSVRSGTSRVRAPVAEPMRGRWLVENVNKPHETVHSVKSNLTDCP